MKYTCRGSVKVPSTSNKHTVDVSNEAIFTGNAANGTGTCSWLWQLVAEERFRPNRVDSLPRLQLIISVHI